MNSADAVRTKIRQLYAFLKEANQLRFRPMRAIGDHPRVLRFADLPAHPSIQIYRPIRTAEGQETPEVLLRVHRPTLTRCPAPPASVATWLLPGWDDPTKEGKVALTQNILVPGERVDDEDTVTIRFEDDEDRLADWEAWRDRRSAWAMPELAARKAMGVFEALYDFYSLLEKDGEQLELLAADGRLSWQASSAIDGIVTIDHPVLLKRAELRFNANVPEFTIHETDREPEIYGSLFVDLHHVELAALRNRKSELETASYHPFGWDDSEAFLRAFIQTISPAAGEFLEQPKGGPASEIPNLWRDPMFILRRRVLGIANAVDAILDDIEQRVLFPPALAQITGTMDEWAAGGLGEDPEDVPGPGRINDDDILLAKEANEEQLQIIRRLERSGSVLVQGPPGTGKTHTIGNLIGHLLAQGKSILVTAQTAKALRVVRDKVPDALRPLCVSVLGSDQDARTQLESSIGSITERLTRDTSESLRAKAAAFRRDRDTLLTNARQLTQKLKDALENEYREIAVSGKGFSPSDAARYVRANIETHSWIPSPVKLGAELTLLNEEFVRLYALSCSYSAQEEQDARCALPDLASVPSEAQFRAVVSEFQELATRDISAGANWWTGVGGSGEELGQIADALQAEFSGDHKNQTWRAHAIVAGMRGGSERGAWELLVSAIARATAANAKHALMLHHRPRLSESISAHKQRQLIGEIHAHLVAGGKIGFLQLATRSEWRQLIKTTSVTAGQPTVPEHFDALGRLAELVTARLDLEDHWNALVGQRAGALFASMMPAPELSCRALVPEIKRCIDWQAQTWAPLAAKLKTSGLRLDELFASKTREVSQIAEYELIEHAASTSLPELVSNEIARRRLRECRTWFAQLADLSAKVDPSAPDRGCVGRLIAAAHSQDPSAYADALEYARRLHSIRPLVEERDTLIAKLRLVASGWADQIAHRVPPHNQGAIVGDHHAAWTWRQLNDTLIARDKLDAPELQRDIDKKRDTLRSVTQWLIEAEAWGKQLERLQEDHSVRQALVGWLDTTKRLASTRQVEKRQLLMSEGRKLMRRCSAAVPVWIMPISLITENFDPRATRFDVVIIDEASQADLNALIPMYMGKQIVVVGDHEQVTPLGVGKNQTMLENLRKSMLQDIPNSHLFDNLFSIYDIGRQSFGDAIRLVEHFRCVPEIIGFSNKLSYDGKIKPLREANSTNLRPACVARRVQGVRENDINRGEAENIVTMIKAMTRHPVYAGKTIGVISLKGEAQAVLIQTMLHKELDTIELEGRRIQAGISGEFQGDERDIIFLSLVDSSTEEGTLRATGDGAFEQTKKRYNVAASRARDQLWVVHSFDPDLNLTSTDLRSRLLRHVKDPQATLQSLEQESRRTESPFEREVLKRLTNAGYLVRTQWQVGYFRIDLVVEGGGRRLAVECDGDRWHPLEKLSADIERQTILERLGWQFVRIRGTAFYRNPDLAMQPVFARIVELEITPEAFSTAPHQAADMTLVHELDEIISQGLEAQGTAGARVQNDAPATAEEASKESPDLPYSATLELDLKQVEVLLSRNGGKASLETFLRDLATAAGYQRLGKNIRAGLLAGLMELQRLGKVSVSGDIVRKL